MCQCGLNQQHCEIHELMFTASCFYTQQRPGALHSQLHLHKTLHLSSVCLNILFAVSATQILTFILVNSSVHNELPLCTVKDWKAASSEQ